MTWRETKAGRAENEQAEAEKSVRGADAGFWAESRAINITYIYIIVGSLKRARTWKCGTGMISGRQIGRIHIYKYIAGRERQKAGAGTRMPAFFDAKKIFL